MDIVIRKYKDNDFASADQLLFDTFGYHKEHLSDERVYEFVACFNDDIVGYFYLTENIDIIRNFKTYHVEYVCVDSQHRGQGIGKKMMEYAIQYAKDHQAVRMELTSGNQREVAHKLYLSLGFEKRDTSVFRKELV